MVAAETVTRYTGTFHGQAEEVSRVRHEITGYLGKCPVADDIVFIANELAANSVMHSASGGEFFTVRCETLYDYVWIECQDLGGPWHSKPHEDRPHGLDIVETLTGPDNWGIRTTSDGDRIVWARLALPLAPGTTTATPDTIVAAREVPVTGTGRRPDLSTLIPGELERTRRDLAALALARPGSPARQPIGTHLAAIDAELASRAGQHSARPERHTTASSEASNPSPLNGGGHMLGPGTGPEPNIDEVRDSLECTRHLRMALDLLEETLPAPYSSDGLIAELWALREKVTAAELMQLRKLGHREYLVIQPLAPAAPGSLVTRAAEAVKILNDLGLVIRLV